MKTKLPLILMVCSMYSFGQTVLLTDNFDSYTNGSTVAAVSSGLWQTWSGGTGTAEDPFISNTYASSGTNSLHVYNNGPGAYLHDIVAPFPSVYNSGIYEVSMKLYVPSSRTAYFNLGSVWATNGTGYEYGIDVFFNTDGSGFVTAAGTGAFTYNHNEWVDVMVRVSFSSGTYQLFINSTSVATGPWGASGLGVIDIFGFGYTDATGTTEGTSDFYVDDFELIKIIGLGVEDNVANTPFSVVPNPSNGQFLVSFNQIESGNYYVEIIDAVGKIVYSADHLINSNNSLPIQLDAPSGIYFVNVNSEKGKMSKKIVIN